MTFWRRSIVVVDFAHSKVRRYIVDRLHNKSLIQCGTRHKGCQIQTYQKAAVRGADVTMVVTSASKELDFVEMMSVLDKVVMPRTTQLQKLGIVKDTVNDHVSSKNIAGGQHQSRAGDGQKQKTKRQLQKKCRNRCRKQRGTITAVIRKQRCFTASKSRADERYATNTSTRRSRKSETKQHLPQQEKGKLRPCQEMTQDHL